MIPNLARRTSYLFLWLSGAVIAIAAIWWFTETRIAEQKTTTHAVASERIRALAEAYADQLHHTLALVDQIALDLKYESERRGGVGELEERRRHGAFPESERLYVTIIDADGNITTSSYASETRPNFSDLEFFRSHRDNCCLGLHISRPEIGRRTGSAVVRFSRRIDKPDGAFAGVVLVSVEPSYLTSFQYFTSGAEGAFVSARLQTGPLLATRIGNQQTGLNPFYLSAPAFPRYSGLQEEPGNRFVDGKPRLVAWRRLENYPLFALAGMPMETAYLPYRQFSQEQQVVALAGSLFVFALAGLGLYYASQAARRQRTEEEVRETYRVATDAANEGFYMLRTETDRHGVVVDFRIEDCNHRGADLYGLSRDELIGRRLSGLKSHVYREELLRLCKAALDTGLVEDEMRVAPPSPLKAKWVYRRIVPSGEGLAVTIRDITAEKMHAEALDRLANRDGVTQLPNRHWVAGFLPDAVARSARASTHLAVMFIDLDNFKNVNDTLGHDAGDELLVQTADRLKRAVRGSDHVARLGGDEFTVLLEHLESTEFAARVAKKILDAVNAPYLLAAGQASNINASIGISIYPDDGLDGETLLKHADIAMYAAKAAGKGRYQFYRSHLSDALILRLGKEQALRQAAEQGQFIVHYQPRVSADTWELKSMEALVRWERPGDGLVYPGDFIDLAEEIGLIVDIGETVIDKVCRQIAEWKGSGVAVVPVSVNVSPYQLKNGNVCAFLESCLVRYGVAPDLIEVELTESAVIDRSEVVERELAALRRLGVKLMIDDFGTGYSSLAQLHRLDVDVLKVDRAFTQALTTGEEGPLVFHAIVSMAEALDMAVVAEGVETREQLQSLRMLACDEIQGFLVSKAVSAGEVTRMLMKRFLLSPSEAEGRQTPA